MLGLQLHVLLLLVSQVVLVLIEEPGVVPVESHVILVKPVIFFLSIVLWLALVVIFNFVLLAVSVPIHDWVMLGLIRVSLDDLVDFVNQLFFSVSESSLGALLDFLCVLMNFGGILVRLLYNTRRILNIGLPHIFRESVLHAYWVLLLDLTLRECIGTCKLRTSFLVTLPLALLILSLLLEVCLVLMMHLFN